MCTGLGWAGLGWADRGTAGRQAVPHYAFFTADAEASCWTSSFYCTHRMAPSAYHALLFVACYDTCLTRILALSTFSVPVCHVQRVCALLVMPVRLASIVCVCRCHSGFRLVPVCHVHCVCVWGVGVGLWVSVCVCAPARVCVCACLYLFVLYCMVYYKRVSACASVPTCWA